MIVSLLLLSIGNNVLARVNKRKNVLFIMADDLGITLNFNIIYNIKFIIK